MGLIQNVVKRQVFGLMAVGVLFLVFLPMFVLMMKPHRDLAYHLSEPDLQRVEGDTFASQARTNTFVEVRGTIDPETLAERSSFFGESFGFLFAVEGYPRTLIVHLTEGELFERLSAAEDAAELLTVIREPVILRGRLYDGDNFMEPFEEYALRDEADPDAYVSEILDDRIDTTPTVFRRMEDKEPDTRRWWLLAVGEKPSPENLGETHLPVFGLGLFFGLGGVIGLVMMRRRKQRSGAGSSGG